MPTTAGGLDIGVAYYFQQTQNDSTKSDSTKTRISRSDSLKLDSLRNRKALDSLAQLPYRPSKLPTFQQKDRFGDPFSNFTSPSPLLLSDPSSLKLDVEMDTGNNYTIYEKIGDLNYRPTTTMTFEEFSQYQDRLNRKQYWKNRSAGLDGESAVSGRRLIPPIYVSPVFDRIFGGSYVELTPRGFVTLDLGARWQRIDNPSIPIRQQRNATIPEFDQQISMNVVGKIGEKLAVTANFDNNNSFDFENNLKVEYTGFEEDIIKKIEIGNVSLPLNNSLISGAQNLFGLKTQMQFGKLYVTGVASTQRGRTDAVEVESGGVQKREFEIRGSNYDENRHFFLGHFFRDNYESWHAQIPQISSGVNINRVEVYILNRNANTQSLRNILGLMDLGEGTRVRLNDVNLPLAGVGTLFGGPTRNGANDLFSRVDNLASKKADEIGGTLEGTSFEFVNGTDYEVVTSARLLDESEYTVNRQLGYISLFRKLQNDEVLAVAYEYTHNGRVYRVGELKEDYASRSEDEVIVLKMLRPRKINIRDNRNRIIPSWDLMMKNVYSLNANQVDKEGFQFRIIYRDDRTGIDNPSLHEGANTRDVPLIELLNLDRLNPNNDPPGDGNFDFVDGVTVNSESGLILFPVLEPFGDHLRGKFELNEQALVQKFVYDTLYGTTKADAQLQTELDKYFLVGSLQAGSSSEIILPGINIAEGSVRVLAGNTPLQEGVDYTVDYNFGKVTIINEGVINSGNRLRITYEKADLFNFQSRSLLGTRFDYQVSEDINFGGTLLYLNERPLVTRVSIGDEPTRNLKYGFDVNIRKESRLLTKMVDALPVLQTKEPSIINFSGEFAQLRPGTSNIINGEGTSYIDDFEATATPFNLGNNFLSWKLASTPQTNNLDPSQLNPSDTLSFGHKRAKLAWYIVDNVFYRSGGRAKPSNIQDDDLSNHYVRAVQPQEIFPRQDRQVINTNETIFDMAYYPGERGPYNYNTGWNSAGDDIRSHWGGITRAITSEVDFDKTNIEYIQFWMLDPFINGPNGAVIDGNSNTNNITGGKLIFNLGSISEDVLKDGKHAFENGLSPDGSKGSLDRTPWGFVTRQQFLNNAFDNDEGARINQDIGLDGLNNEEERNFTNFPQALRVLEDPSSDDFQYYLDPEFDANDISVLERYKNFNGPDGNSPVLTNNSLPYTPSGSTIPENEDLNNDNTLSDLEEYYEYTLDLGPGQLRVGEKFIVDKVTSPVRLPDGSSEEVTWYQFRIPVRDFDGRFGNIQGFKSIRYLRTYLTGWQQPVVLRFANFQLVGSQWRRFTESLREDSFEPIPEPDFTGFTVSVVNVEENSQGSENSSPYVLPPGFSRDRDNTSAIERSLNEQALQVCIDDLPDKEARGVFKNVDLDLISYGRIKMFLHAESNNATDDELVAFLRLGTDRKDNYYEVEVPLKVTPFGLTSTGEQLQRDVWPLENEIDLALSQLFQLKARRNRVRSNDDFVSIYSEQFSDGNRNYTLRIRGNPEISAVNVMMIGVRNPATPDQAPKSVCLWANELRVTDFDRRSGWAANATLSTKLADFATVSASTRLTTFGFGGIQTKISDRERAETFEYDVAANVAVDKLIPGNTGIKIPMYASYQKSTTTPEFDPKNPDIPLEETLNSFDTERQGDTYKDIVQQQSVRRSLNFTNVRKEKTKPDAKSHVYDIENFSFTYAYSDETRSDFNTESYVRRNYNGAVDYNFTYEPIFLEPFKKVKLLNSPYLKLIQDLNLSPLPSSFSVRADLNRSFIRTRFRDENLDPLAEANYEKSFIFNRTYSMRWSLTRSISLDYNARASSIIDEPDGEIDDAAREQIWENLKDLGRIKNFDQDIGANYRVPLDKFPVTDWVNADLRYAVGYTWTAGAIGQQDTLGNVIQNSRDRNVTGKFDLVKLYNKVKFLKEINSPPRRNARPNNRRTQQQAQDTIPPKPELKAVKGFFRFLMSLRSINVTYGQREGTLLPGFLPEPRFFGLDDAFETPGVSFILGSQNPDIRRRAAANGWLGTGTTLTNPFSQSSTVDLSIRASVEPFKDFKIQLDAKKSKSAIFQEIFRDTIPGNDISFASLNPSRNGSYSISFLSIRTAFISDREDNSSPIFDDYQNNLAIIRSRLNALNPQGEYDTLSQDVLIPAFIAAYTGKDPNSVDLTPFPRTPIPNWRVDYKGLGNIPALKEVFSSVTITHSYNSTYSIGNFANSLLFQGDIGLDNNIEDYPLGFVNPNATGMLLPAYVVNQVNITERFSPLIGVTIRTKSRMTAKVEYKTERNMTLNLSNTQITELSNKDFAFDFGWTKANFKVPFRVKGRTVTLKNDLTMRVNFTIRDTQTLQRSLSEGSTVTQGNLNFQLRPNIGYVLNERLNLQVYFERNINEPKVSNSFRRTTTAFGAQIRFSLAQ